MRDILGKTLKGLLGEADKLTDQQSEAIGRRFVKYERLMHRLVEEHIHKYGGDYDALFSRASDTLIVAHLRHNPGRSVWKRYIYHQIRWGLLDLHLEAVRRKLQVYTNADEILAFMSSPTRYHGNEEQEIINDIYRHLTPDARLYLMHTQRDVESKSRREMNSKFRVEMRAKGWSGNRANAAIVELGDILKWLIHEVEE